MEFGALTISIWLTALQVDLDLHILHILLQKCCSKFRVYFSTPPQGSAGTNSATVVARSPALEHELVLKKAIEER